MDDITDEIEDENSKSKRKAFFVPTPDEIQAACVEIQNSWTDDIRDSRRVLSMCWLGSDSELE